MDFVMKEDIDPRFFFVQKIARYAYELDFYAEPDYGLVKNYITNLLSIEDFVTKFETKVIEATL